MTLESPLGALLLMVKNACFQTAAVLTVLVILGNELRRRRIMFTWLEERYLLLRRSWHASLGLSAVTAVLYAMIKHEPTTLVVDAVTLVGMVGAVIYFDRRPRGQKPRVRRATPETSTDPLPGDRTDTARRQYPRSRRRRRPRPL